MTRSNDAAAQERVSVVVEVVWAIRQPDGMVISCELRTVNKYNFELVLLADRARTYSQQFLTRLNALLEADAMRDRVIAAVGGAPVVDRRRR
jgi:hypothetical protein